jgi:arylsulfatase A-like enzyme
MIRRALLFLAGLSPLLLTEVLLGSGPIRSGLTLALVPMLALALVLALLFPLGEFLILRWLVPPQHRGSELTSWAMGLTLFVAAALPNLLPQDLLWSFRNRFVVGVAYLAAAGLVLYPVMVRLLATRGAPRRPGLILAAVLGLTFPLSWGLEQAERPDEQAGLRLPGQAILDAPRKPNVLLVVLDTLRYDTMQQLWEGEQHFPHLDAFTADAAHFERGYAGCNVTPGGHSTLLTGYYPAETGTLARGNVRLDETYLTVAEFLQDYGYRTGATVSNVRVSGRFGYQQGFEAYDDSLVNSWIDFDDIGSRLAQSNLVQLFGAPHSRKLVGGAFAQLKWETRTPNAADTSRTTLAMVDDMDIGEDEPWFLFLNYMDPHTPFVTREDLAAAFGPGLQSPLEENRHSIIRFTEDLRRMANDLRRGKDRSTDLAWLQEVYREQCLELDEGLHQLLVGLEERGMLDEETLILFTSDHGEHLGEHGAFNHGGTLLDEEVRVPFLLMGPDIVPGRVKTPVSGTDFFATVCYAMGLEDEEFPPTAGVPLQEPRAGRVIRFEHGLLRGFLIDTVKMVAEDRDGELHWIQAFDLAKDPQELDNLIDNGLPWVEALKANPPIRSSADAGRIEAGDGSVDLAGLGYVDEVAD